MKIIQDRSVSGLEKRLNAYFLKGYQISGGVTVDNGFYMVIVVKPF